jgi:hypothetical protein
LSVQDGQVALRGGIRLPKHGQEGALQHAAIAFLAVHLIQERHRLLPRGTGVRLDNDDPPVALLRRHVEEVRAAPPEEAGRVLQQPANRLRVDLRVHMDIALRDAVVTEREKVAHHGVQLSVQHALVEVARKLKAIGMNALHSARRKR